MKKIRRIGALVLLLCTSSAFSEGNQILINSLEFGSQTFNYEDIEGYTIIEGDIILGKTAEIKGKGTNVHRYLNKRWPKGILPYKISADMPIKNRIYIFQAMDEIESKTNVRFAAITCENASQYKDYVEFIPSQSTCSSYVGKLGGRQTISLARGCLRGASIHEIAHALGFWHEQSRADRDSYVRVQWENIKDTAKGNFNFQVTNGFMMGGYDYKSIMHYGPKAFSKNGQATIVPLDSSAVIGQRDGLSVIDAQSMNKIYPEASIISSAKASVHSPMESLN